jgi:hypothetical protein
MKAALLAFFITTFLNSWSQQNNLSAGAGLLFQNIKSKLTNAEKESVFKLTGFLLSSDKKQFIADKDGAEFPFSAFIYPADLNKDGKEEIFILFGNTYTSGSTGSSIIAFTKNTANQYIVQLGFPGTLPDVVTTPTTGYPDLIIGGPGFEYPVWKWKAGKYEFSKNIKEAELRKLKTENIESLSRKYMDQIK